MLQELATYNVHPNPDQPRKDFDQAALNELASSIRAHGLMQPITVREAGERNFVIVMGERRWRAHKLAGLATIRAEVVEIAQREADEQSIIENLQRVDISPIEEANAYRRMLETYGYTPAELAARLGLKQPWRITERTSLLALAPEYQDLLRKGHIGASQAFEMSRLAPRGQAVLFQAIKAGRCASYATLRNAADALAEAEAQIAMFSADEAPRATAEEAKAARGFERKIERVAKLLRDGIKDNEIVAVSKVDPTRAETLAERMGEMQKSLKAIELALRQAAITTSFKQVA